MDHTIVIGAGQAGLAAGYHLARRGLPVTILEADDRVGGAWNHRWDSMRVFTPAPSIGLPGVPFPRGEMFPAGAQVAEYLSAYAERVGLDVRTGVAVDGVFRDGERFQVTAGAASFTAANVVLATGAERVPNVPSVAERLSSRIVQLHSADYRNPSQLQPGGVAVVGAANSGADLALELAATHEVVLCGRHPGHIPLRIESRAMLAVFPLIALTWNHVLTRETPPGRRSREKVLAGRGAPLIRVKPWDLDAAGVRRAGRVVDVTDGLPVTADGDVLDVANVVWATGFLPGHGWLELPGLDSSGFLDNDRGAVTGQPGLYVLGQLFQHRFSSHNALGVVLDAELVVGDIARRAVGAGASVRP
ncbi:flavin-containing monooxygenase [Oceanitalea stevensii]|uniref:FAD-dependent oxidoreductase n=1 Tax=Oceanitalea stevensii TaxID=2763072 RepID=A0ABR8YYJ5_9MICO|nr:FAD-dependent oxidoreductase [Oceanitalea stevensii]MBD8060868.1 FAD-dependent oxidoreductase [Oceanitalea stevensii]